MPGKRYQAKCSTCQTEIDWALTLDGRPMPVDHDSVDKPEGNLAVWRDEDGRLCCRMLKADDTLGPGEHRGVPHWATCKQAREHKRGGRR